MTRTHLVLSPRDGLSLKDPRSYDIAGGLPATGLPWPTPPTVAGAVRAAIGIARGLPTRHGEGKEAWRQLLDEISIGGPLAVVRSVGHTHWEPLWPAPRDVLRLPPRTERRSASDPIAQWIWLNPTYREGHAQVRGNWSGTDPEGLATEGLWLPSRPMERGKPLEARKWWTKDELQRWLRAPQTREEKSFIDLPELRNDTRLAVDHRTGAARDQHLFGQPTQEVLFGHGRDVKEVGIALWVDTASPPPSAWIRDPWRVGGETRFAQAHVTSDLYDDDVLSHDWRPSRFFRLCLVTPGCFAPGWRPDWLSPVQSSEGTWRFEGFLPNVQRRVVLRAAFIDRPQWISGWDLAAKGPKPSTPCVRAGAAYYFEALDGELSAAEIRTLWLSSIQTQGSEHRRNGFGLVVPGAWPQTT